MIGLSDFEGTQTAVQQVVSFVERGLGDKTFSGGERLPTEAEISAAVGVSRTPVREAIKILEAMGVLEIRRGIGTFLRPQATAALGHLMVFQAAMGRATPQQLFETRLMVEQTAAELSASRRTDKDVAAMRAANERMRALSTAPSVDLDQLTAADVAFHHAIFDACGNELVATIGKFVVGLFAPWIREGHRRVGGLVSVRNHEMIVAMIESRNGGGAREAAFDRSVSEGLSNWQAALEKDGSTSEPASGEAGEDRS